MSDFIEGVDKKGMSSITVKTCMVNICVNV